MKTYRNRTSRSKEPLRFKYLFVGFNWRSNECQSWFFIFYVQKYMYRLKLLTVSENSILFFSSRHDDNTYYGIWWNRFAAAAAAAAIYLRTVHKITCKYVRPLFSSRVAYIYIHAYAYVQYAHFNLRVHYRKQSIQLGHSCTPDSVGWTAAAAGAGEKKPGPLACIAQNGLRKKNPMYTARIVFCTSSYWPRLPRSATKRSTGILIRFKK